MQIIINNHKYRYEMENISRMFFHDVKMTIEYDVADVQGDYVLTEIRDNEILVELSLQGKKESKREKIADFDEQKTEWQMATMLYNLLVSASGKAQKWGLLTGVRPTRLVHRMLDEGKSIAEIKAKFSNEYLVSDDKFRLVWQTAQVERNIVKDTNPRDFSLYISIPFCPSRCNYCSFVSGSVEKFAAIIPQYVELLGREIEHTGSLAKQLGLRLKSVYFGGGTPTTLTAAQLEFLMKKIEQSFDLSGICEYTVEAGRPDTVTQEKLQTIYRMGADRISINPQTFNDEVLKAIGRKHTTQQTLEAYELASKIGFKTINMDLIAGLTDDTFESFCSSLDTAISLKPQNITLHTLTVKRAANLAENGSEVFKTGESTVEKMVGISRARFYDGGYMPYYMYRQKGTLSNLENVGYCISGHEGYYNIYIMDEVHTILALGAGAVTKLKTVNGEDIKRVYNYKYPLEYVKDFNNIIDRKQEILSFYNTHPF